MAKRVRVLSPEGKIGTIPEDQLASASKSGFQTVTDQEVQEIKDQKEFGSPLEQLKTGAEGLARGATFGLSDAAESALGVSTPERIRKRREINPGVSGVSEGAGIIGSSWLAPETSLAGLLEKGAGRVGEKVAGGIAESSLMKPVVKSAVRSAVEGAGFGVGNSITEEALGDHELSAEQIVGNIGLNAILGGAIGGGSSLLGYSVKNVARKMGNTLTDLIDKHTGRLAEEFSKKGDNISAETLQKTLGKALKSDNPGERLIDTKAMSQKIADDFSAHESLYHTSEAAKTDLANAYLDADFPGQLQSEGQTKLAGEFVEKLENLHNELEAAPDKHYQPDVYRLKHTLDEAVYSLSQNRTPSGLYHELQRISNKLENFDGETNTIKRIRAAATDMKKVLADKDAWGRAGNLEAEHAEVMGPYKQARQSMMAKFGHDDPMMQGALDSSKIENSLNGFGMEHGTEDTANLLSQYNGSSRQVRNYMNSVNTNLGNTSHLLDPEMDSFSTGDQHNLAVQNVKDFIQQQMKLKASQEGNDLFNIAGGAWAAKKVAAMAGLSHAAGPVGMAYGGYKLYKKGSQLLEAARNPTNQFQAMQFVLNNKGKSIDALNKGLDFMLNHSGRPINLGARALSAKLMQQDEEVPRDYNEHMAQTLGEISQLANDPGQLIDTLSGQTQDFQHLPKTQQALVQKATQAVGYLNQYAPKPLNSITVLKQRPEFDARDVRSFNRRLDAVDNPYGVLEHPTKEGVETLQALYPKLYQKMMEQLLNRLSMREDNEVSRIAKQNVEDVFGIQLMSKSPQAFARLQGNFSQGQEAPQFKNTATSLKSRRASSKQMKISDHSETDVQKIQNRG